MAKAFRHAGIVVSDLSKALDLFKNYLGCELVGEYPKQKGDFFNALLGLDNVVVSVAIVKTHDNNRIELLQYESNSDLAPSAPCPNRIGISHIALTVENLQELYESRHLYNVRFISPPLLSPDGMVQVAYVELLGECISELVQVLDPRANFSGGD